MQRARRRLTCSNALLSLETSLNAKKKSSKTSSAGGDFAQNKSPKKPGDETNIKAKLRRIKYKTKISSNLKYKKNIKTSMKKQPKNGLRNAVVLAPFNTLKKCIQAKLMNLYTSERMKKFNQKMKNSQKSNNSFQYEVIELKSVPQKFIKKEPKKLKVLHKQQKKEKNEKRKRLHSYYCQCLRDKIKPDFKTPKQSSTKKKRSLPIRELLCSSLTNKNRNKRRKLDNNEAASPTVTKTDLLSMIKSDENFYSAGRSDLSISVVSSPSKVESWDTYSDTYSSKEERLEGSLAISTTSFDSFWEEIEKETKNMSKNKKQNLNRRKPGRKGRLPKKSANEPINAPTDLLPKQKTTNSKQLLISSKTSDGRIIDFMDREPQAQLIASLETSQNLHPLRRQSKGKTKSQTPNEGKPYFLRSLTQNKELPSEMSNCNQAKVEEHNLNRQSSSKINKLIENSSEMVTQDDSNFGYKSTLNLPTENQIKEQNTSKLTSNTTEASNSAQKIYSSSEKLQKKQNPTVDSVNNDSSTNVEQTKQENKSDEEKDNQSDSHWLQEFIDAADQSDRESIQFLASSNEVNRINAPEDKESSFIFGDGNPQNRVGESCEFSFGMNWVFPDDEEEDRGNNLF